MNRAMWSAAGAILLAIFSVAGAFAQPSESPPASHSSLDGNGVDLITGEFYPPYPTISIGQGPGSISYSRSKGYSHIDSMYGGINASGSTYTVTLLGQSTVFTKSGSNYSPAEGQGGTLVHQPSLARYTYTSPAGIEAIYTTSMASLVPTQANIARIQRITYPTGEVLNYVYSAGSECTAYDDFMQCLIWVSQTRLDAVESSLGYRLDYDHLSDTCCSALWTALGGVTVKSLFGSGTWQSFTFSGGITDEEGRTYSYPRDTAGRIIGYKGPGASSNDITVTYDSSDRVATLSKLGLTWTYNYADNGSTRTTTVTAPGSAVRTVTSDTSTNRVTSDRNALNQTTSYQYDSYGRLTRVTPPEGNYTTYTYDSRGNITAVKNYNKSGGSPITSFEASYPSSCTNPKTCNKPTWTKDALGRQTDYTYASFGEITSIKTPSPGSGISRANTTFHYWNPSVYDSSTVWRLTRIRRWPLTTSETCVGDAAESLVEPWYSSGTDALPGGVRLKSGDGAITSSTSISYDHQRRPYLVDGPLSGTDDRTRTFYNDVGQVTGTIGPDPDGGGSLKYRATRISYNSRGLPYLSEAGTTTSASSMASFAALQSTTTTFDSYGRAIKETFAAGGVTYGVAQISFDSRGRVDCTAQRMNPAVFGSAPAACSLGSTGSFGEDRITRTTYDALNRPLKTTTAYGTTVAADVVTRAYTTNGQLFTLTDGEGNKTTYEYDAHDRLSKTRYPSKAAAGTSSSTDYEQWTYRDTGAAATWRNRDGITATYGYDNLERVISVTGTSTRTTAYDNLGRVTQLTVNSGWPNVSYDYDALGRMTREIQVGGTVDYTYDVAGRMTRMDYPGPNSFYVNYDYDISGAVTKVREKGATSGSGVLAEYDYDDLGRRVKRTLGNDNVIDYAYDGAGRLTDLDFNFQGTTHDQDLDFSYNPAGQITQAARSNDVFAFLDHFNIDNVEIINGLNQATSIGGSSVTYDDNGNVGSWDGETYTYDNENFLTDTGSGAELHYDAAGRLHWVEKGGSAFRFLYAGGAIIGENSAPGSTTLRRYVHGAGVDEPIVWYEGDDTTDRRWLTADERGSIIAVANDLGTVTDVNTYDAYGRPGASSVGRFQYTGQAWIDEVELYYYKVRFYNPELGRFMQTDPIGYGDGMNMYGYVGGDPVNYADPTGESLLAIAAIGGTSGPTSSGSLAASSVANFAMTGFFTFGNDAFGAQWNGGEVRSFLGGASRAEGADSNDESGYSFAGCATVSGSTACASGTVSDGQGQLNEVVSGTGNISHGALEAIVGNASPAIDCGSNCGEAADASYVMDVAGGVVAITKGAVLLGVRYVGNPNRINSSRVLLRETTDTGPHHNFPSYFDDAIYAGNRQTISSNYVLYSQRGYINNTAGVFEIGVRPSASGRTEIVVHRFFRPDR